MLAAVDSQTRGALAECVMRAFNTLDSLLQQYFLCYRWLNKLVVAPEAPSGIEFTLVKKNLSISKSLPFVFS